MHPLDERLLKLDIQLGEPMPPGGAYRPLVTRGGIGFLAAQFPIEPDLPPGSGRFVGRLGADLDAAQGQKAARLAAVHALSRIRFETGIWEDFGGLCHVSAMLLTTPEFAEHSTVLDGASDFFNEVLGLQGLHSRSLAGVNSLPHGLCIELVVTFAVTASVCK